MTTRGPEPTRGTDDPAELAERYVAGDMSLEEARGFEARVAAGDEDCRRELRRLMPLEEALNSVTAGWVPGRGVREAIDARLGDLGRSDEGEAVRAEEHADAESKAGMPVILHAAGRRWRRTGLHGVRYQTLFADRAANRRTVLLEMAPGSVFPDHEHASIEEVILLEGDLAIGGTVLRKHDYIRIRPGVAHGEPRSEGGCIALVISGYSLFTRASHLSMAWHAVTRALGFGRPRA
jgi:hypothetical protein